MTSILAMLNVEDRDLWHEGDGIPRVRMLAMDEDAEPWNAATSSWKARQMDDLANVGWQSPRSQSTAAVPTAACLFSFDRWV